MSTFTTKYLSPSFLPCKMSHLKSLSSKFFSPSSMGFPWNIEVPVTKISFTLKVTILEFSKYLFHFSLLSSFLSLLENSLTLSLTLSFNVISSNPLIIGVSSFSLSRASIRSGFIASIFILFSSTPGPYIMPVVSMSTTSENFLANSANFITPITISPKNWLGVIVPTK
ncbi:168aa long hypothetical protein [Pyrococcus horikoshii OT3]|uniref:Uncharacterized protein n=1 Tax=Pyrococcus horikoshii (strain ATCC 700860 / DSM 12428 / JCM 9974 / NBRC 100139 / OT-3) TaxID=70601 RepID=O57937_PYRHO|nr:168aa long hypothetical protein [Pyrococcus horikoshii OT3]